MIETSVIQYDITDAAIAEMASIYLNLEITDLADKEQFDAVHSARMTVKGKRVEVEKRRKELKADALEFGRMVDGKAKEIFAKLEPIESHLDKEERKVTDEQKRIKEEEDRKFKEMVEARIAELAAVGAVLPFNEIAALSDDEYTETLAEYRAKDKEIKAQIAAEEAARKAEAEALEKQRAEQAAKEAELAEERRKLEAEKAAIEEAKRIEIAKAEAAEKARQEERDRIEREQREKEEAERLEKERVEREAREAKEKAEAKEAERVRLEALRPDKEKLSAWADSLLDTVAPELADKDMQAIADRAIVGIYEIAHGIHKEVER